MGLGFKCLGFAIVSCGARLPAWRWTDISGRLAYIAACIFWTLHMQLNMHPYRIAVATDDWLIGLAPVRSNGPRFNK